MGRAPRGGASRSAVSAAQLRRSPAVHPPPIEQVVYLRPYPDSAGGGLISGRASHLDAFSAYPPRTWLPGDAVGTTTRTPAVRPSRSSRTGAGPPQTSCAHTG